MQAEHEVTMAKKMTPPRAAISGCERPGLHDFAPNFACPPRLVMSDNAQLRRSPLCPWVTVLDGGALVAKSRDRWRALVLAAALVVLLTGLRAQQADGERQLRVFAPQTTYVVPLVEHNGVPYVGLFEVLEPLGRVESRADQQKWRLKFTAASARAIEVEFTQGETRGKLAGSGYDLPSEFVLIAGRGFVPVTTLGGILPRILSQAVQLYPGNRLLIGALGFSFHQQVRQNPHSLVLSFASAVNPMIATEPGP